MNGLVSPAERLSRRELLTCVLGGVLCSLVPRGSAAQQPVVPLSDRLSLLTSGGTNVLALSTGDGLVLVDSGAPNLRDPLMASLRQIGAGGRIRTLFNTHYHSDNTGANEVLRERGAAIVAHENTRLWMAISVWVPAEDRYRPPRPKSAHPNETFRVDGSTNVGGERIDYGYLIEAHTSGDIYVFFRDANVLAVGDVASPVRDPELDYFTGAWLGGRVDALTRLLTLSDADTRIVPGFGPVVGRADLMAERDVLKTIYDRAVDRIRQGDAAADMLDAGVMNGLTRTWKDPRKFLYDVQKGLWAHHNKLNPNVV
jgi:glyoxylase-like metal-dependent hydrolase (beta-lactamase superfamily II)